MASLHSKPLDGFGSDDFDQSTSAVVDGLPSRRNNALGAKITGVLSSSFADYELRDALRLLDERGLENDEETRRSLKANAQKEVIDCNARVVEEFGQVAEQLKRVGAMLTTLNETCTSMRQHIVAAKQESDPVLDEATTLLGRKQETELKQQLLDAFTAHFLISASDLNILTSSAEPLDERFFVVLARTKQIHRDCEILLGSENQRLGLELLEQTTRNLDAGFKKLYTWIQREFKGLDLEDPHISGSIRRALRVLSERPTMFQNCLDFFAEARQVTLSEAFHDALTGSSGAAKAIEFSTHEVLRYVGDMMAWVHSAAVSEKEALEGLFISDADEISKGLSQRKASEPWARVTRTRTRLSVSSSHSSTSSTSETDHVEPVFDGRKALADLISRNLSTVSQTLQSRVEISVRNSGDAVLMYKTFNLLDFYWGVFTNLLGADSSLGKLVEALKASTLAQFESAMEEETAAAVTDYAIPPDLSPPTFLATALSQFSETALARGPHLHDGELEHLYAAILGVILSCCAEAVGKVTDTHRRIIYRLNYISSLKSTLATVATHAPAASVPLEKAGLEIQNLHDQLVEHVAASFLDVSGVQDLMQELDSRRSHSAALRRGWLTNNLHAAAQRLDDFLASALMDAQEQLQHLVDRGRAKDIVAEAVEKFCTDFEELEGMLDMVDAESLPSPGEEHLHGDTLHRSAESLRDLYPRTGAEVRALLS